MSLTNFANFYEKTFPENYFIWKLHKFSDRALGQIYNAMYVTITDCNELVGFKEIIEVMNDIQTQYKYRDYHNLHHLQAMIQGSSISYDTDSLNSSLIQSHLTKEQSDILLVSILYHDYFQYGDDCYNDMSFEVQSFYKFKDHFKSYNVPLEISKHVEDCIRLTIHEPGDKWINHSVPWMLFIHDLDLMHFSSRKDYDFETDQNFTLVKIGQKIRMEYIIIEYTMFYTNHLKIMESFLERPTIFKTEQYSLRSDKEKLARYYLEEYVQQLKSFPNILKVKGE